MPGPDLEPFPTITPGRVDILRDQYQRHGANPHDPSRCRQCPGNAHPCYYRQTAYVALVGAGVSPERPVETPKTGPLNHPEGQ